MCVGSDLMQNKGNKVQNEFFFFNQVSINFLQCAVVAMRSSTVDGMQSIVTAHFFFINCGFSNYAHIYGNGLLKVDKTTKIVTAIKLAIYALLILMQF